MFKWPDGQPSARAPQHELADFLELRALRENGESMTGLSEFLGRNDENDYSQGVPADDHTVRLVEEAYEEIEARRERCGAGGYPFHVPPEGNSLHPLGKAANHRHVIYVYLLLATRLNMKSNRIHDGIDGTLLFEEVSAEVAREYLGARAESIVFGTNEGSGFRAKVNELCKRMREGGGYREIDDQVFSPQDGKLDVVAWKHFSDGLPGKLTLFGQCKTGTNYGRELTQLQPDSFCKKWIELPLALTPVRLFFVSEALPESRWSEMSIDAGLLFDRCRIIDYCGNLSERVLERARVWTQAAARATGLPGI